MFCSSSGSPNSRSELSDLFSKIQKTNKILLSVLNNVKSTEQRLQILEEKIDSASSRPFSTKPAIDKLSEQVYNNN